MPGSVAYPHGQSEVVYFYYYHFRVNWYIGATKWKRKSRTQMYTDILLDRIAKIFAGLAGRGYRMYIEHRFVQLWPSLVGDMMALMVERAIDEVCFLDFNHTIFPIYIIPFYVRCAYKLKTKNIAKFIRTNWSASYDVMPLDADPMCCECANTKSPPIDAKHKIDCWMHFNGP